MQKVFKGEVGSAASLGNPVPCGTRPRAVIRSAVPRAQVLGGNSTSQCRPRGHDKTRNPCQLIGISSCVQTSRVRMFLQLTHDGVGDRWVTLSCRGQTVYPAGPIGAQARSHSTAQAQPTKHKGDRRGIRHFVEQPTHAVYQLWQTRLTTEWENSGQTCGLRCRAMQQASPSTLEILHTGDPAQQNFMFSDGVGEMRCNKLWVPQWRTLHLDALFVWWQRRPSPHSGSCIGLPDQPFELIARLWTDVAAVMWIPA